MKNAFFGALFIVLASNTSLAASAMTNLYVQSAAAWERCTGNKISMEQADALSKLIKGHPLESNAPTAQELLAEVRKSQPNGPNDCDVPLTKIDRDYFENYVLPRINSFADAQEASSRNTHNVG